MSSLTNYMRASYFTWFFKYEQFVKRRLTANVTNTQNDVNQWQDRLFVKFLIYCFPASLIALIPCVYISFADGYLVIGIVDIACFFFIAAITLLKRPSLRQRKVAIIGLFYVLAIFLTSALGYLGPGVFYLFAITVLSALIFPGAFAWFTIAVNAAILLGFAALIHFAPPGGSLLGKEYTTGQWLAFSSNLIFLSILLVLLINKMFAGLQSVITSIDQIKVKYKVMFESSPLPMWLFDVETLNFLDVNEAAVKSYGYSKAEFLGMTIKDIRPPEYKAGIEQVVRLNKDVTNFYHSNVIHTKKNGEEINVKIESSLLDFNGYEAKLVLANDITGQIKSQEEIQRSSVKIKQSESNLRAIFENTNEGFVLLDIDNCIIVFNSKAKESVIFNANQAEFENGRNIFDFIDESKKAGFHETLQKVHTGKVIDYDQKFYIRGIEHWVHFTITPVTEGGLIAGSCIAGRDITEHKKYVHTIEEQNKKFREISWIQSHLVRAPLARVMGLAALLATETDDKEKDEMLKLLEISSVELDNIIKEITRKTAVSAKIKDLSSVDYL